MMVEVVLAIMVHKNYDDNDGSYDGNGDNDVSVDDNGPDDDSGIHINDNGDLWTRIVGKCK